MRSRDYTVISPRDAQDVSFDERTGILVALSVHWPDSTTFRLVASNAGGEEIDRVDYRDPWASTWPAADEAETRGR